MKMNIGIILLSTFVGTSALKLKSPSVNMGLDSFDEDANSMKMDTGCRKQPLAPTECGANDRFSSDQLKAKLKEFKDVWAGVPKGGKLSINHQFAEWFLIQELKPSVIIESGVLHGQATWGLRKAAGPDARIFSFDPVDQTKLGFRDRNPNTTYMTNEKWKDLAVIDWDSLGLSKEDRSNAVVILDDHQIFYDRFETLKDSGFRHIFVEDNNKYGFGNTAPNFFCTKPEEYNDLSYAPPTYHISELIYANSLTASAQRADNPKTYRKVSWAEHKENSKKFQASIKSYFEFPAVYDPCEARPSLLSKSELREYGLTAPDYQHRYPPYFEIRASEESQ